MKARTVPRRSLRTILMLWFLLFSVAPLAFITGYSLVKYEQALDQELGHRIEANLREIGSIIADFESVLIADSKQLAGDKSLSYYIATNNFKQARELVDNWMRSHYAHHVWVWSAEGRLEVALYRNATGDVERLSKMEGGDVYLSDLKSLQAKDQLLDVDLRGPANKKSAIGVVELMVFTAIKSQNGRTVGYLQQVVNLEERFLQALKGRLGVEMVLYRPDQEKIVATNEDLAVYQPSFFTSHAESGQFFDMNIRSEPYRFLVKELAWGDTKLDVALGASKQMAKAVLKNVNYAFFTVVAAIVVLLIILSVVTSRILLKPLYDVLDAIRNLDTAKEMVAVPVNNETELGLLAQSFNEMAERTFDSQKALRGKIHELETANAEIRETQAKLVHTAKMASLGQLVAGVAHELNNPIGFIYSNLGVLRDYSDRLVRLVRTAETKPQNLSDEKQNADFDYLVQDLPKLIASCEDGARRTRDIVLGLRNFSRLDEAQVKEVDLHEGLESTLQLLTGELKNRIRVHRDFAKLPKVTCYASQINQVFMNILSNAAQAIEGNGEIFISTRTQGVDQVAITIRDTGRGMDRATVEKVFDPFFTTKAQGAGTGLGLSISYGVVQKHGGDIIVQSEPGKGTEFTILLPVKGV
ncbi:MAG: ATP-binding protein [Bdellovibrionales bacterium]